MFELAQVFSESCGYQSLCSINVIKSTHPNFEHTKYEPDLLTYIREKWGVKIVGDFRTPCRSNGKCSKEVVIMDKDLNGNLSNGKCPNWK